jgi:alanine-synthesizing transaminase
VIHSARVPDDLAPNPLAAAIARARTEKRAIIDLTESNPTRARLDYPADLLAPLAHRRGLTYAPDPLGLPEARQAVAGDFARRGVAVSPDRLVLAASTSEAYSILFKLLCAPGDQVLVPRPSYPLFEHLTRLDGVESVPYDLEYHGHWEIDVAGLDRAFTPRTRAVLLVSPNNPTGSFVSPAELDRIAASCQTRNAAIISDEVFADYELTPGAAAASARLSDRSDVLGFTLGGLSKSVGLPQLKLAWIALSGPETDVRDGRTRLELVCDTYLSVSTPIQLAAAELLAGGASVRAQIQQRIAANYEALQHATSAVPSCEVLRAGGGWYAVVRVPSLTSEEGLVLALLEEDGVLVHPGYFFDFPVESFLVLSLLAPEPAFAHGTACVLRRFAPGSPRP